MGHKFWGNIGLLASIVASTGAAGAADLPLKAPMVVPAAPVYIYDWTGFYIGINGGGGFGDNKFDMIPTWNKKPSGGLVGGHAGYAWQSGSIVGGLEVDFDGADITKTFTPVAGTSVREKTDELATARARLGYLVLPDLLAYGTAGAAWGHTEVNKTAAAAITTNATDQFGWAAGAGLEYKFWNHFIARVEYLHYDFAKTSLPAFGPFRESINAVRGGLSYKF
jgi:outer membrane immunogenic protein